MNKLFILILISLTGCMNGSKNHLAGNDITITYDQLILYHLYTEAKCNSWNKNITKSEVCLLSMPIYSSEDDSYLFKFGFLFHEKSEIDYFNNSDESTRLKILRSDINHVKGTWCDFIQLVNLQNMYQPTSNQVIDGILNKMIIQLDFGYMDSLSDHYYQGTWDAESDEVQILKKQRLYKAI